MSQSKTTPVKILDLYRHSKKMGNNISVEGLELAMASAFKVDHEVSDLFRGPLERTLETLTACRCGSDMFDEAILHPPIFGLGNSEIFSGCGMITEGFKKALKDGNNFQAVLDSATDEQVQIWTNYGREALMSMFMMMSGKYGWGLFHDPTIPLMARSMGFDLGRSLKEMEGLRFALMSDGSIQIFLIED